MTHRKDVAYMLINFSRADTLKMIAEEHFSRYLLCNGSIEEVTGIVAVKDIIALLDSDEPFNLENASTPPLFIPESMSANRILELFRSQKTNFGVVVSEYGAVEGIVTLHDLTEAILGELPEEDEEPEFNLVVRPDGSILVDGSMNIDDFIDKMGIDANEEVLNEGFTTLGGLTMYLLDKMPVEGDTFVFSDYKFEVVDMDNSRVDKLLIWKPQDSDSQN
jgi:putative hemolysin